MLGLNLLNLAMCYVYLYDVSFEYIDSWKGVFLNIYNDFLDGGYRLFVILSLCLLKECIACIIRKIFFIFKMYLGLLVFITEKALAPHSSTLAWKIPWILVDSLQRFQSLFGFQQSAVGLVQARN